MYSPCTSNLPRISAHVHHVALHYGFGGCCSSSMSALKGAFGLGGSNSKWGTIKAHEVMSVGNVSSENARDRDTDMDNQNVIVGVRVRPSNAR